MQNAERDAHVSTQNEDSHLHAKKGGLGRNRPADTLTSNFLPPEL